MERHTSLAQRKKWLNILDIHHHEEVSKDPGYTASPQCMARHTALAQGMRLCVAVNTSFAQCMEMVTYMGTIKLESDSVRKYPEGKHTSVTRQDKSVADDKKPENKPENCSGY
jgi:hypothetical protein